MNKDTIRRIAATIVLFIGLMAMCTMCVIIMTNCSVNNQAVAATAKISNLGEWELSDRMYVPAETKASTAEPRYELTVASGALQVPEDPAGQLYNISPAGQGSDASYTGDAATFMSQGVMNWNGWRVTWYRPAVLGISAYQLGLNTIGAPIVDRGDGIGVCDSLIAVALPANFPYGYEIDTPFGMGVCVDHSQSAMDVVIV